MTVLLVALGAAVGAPTRYLADRFVRSRLGPGFPWGTLLVNVVGSALLGTGFCGALTTYSTFGHETLRLARAGARGRALAYVLASAALGVTAALGGAALA